MPEGDTVWLAGKRLHEALTGDRLVRSDFRVPSLATVDLSGRTVLEVVPRGKHLLTRLSGGLTLHTHFRMDGSWHLYRPGDRWTGGPDWQVRAVLETASWQAVGYRLPVVELLETADEDAVVGHLGPDVLGPDWDAAEAVRRLLERPEREVGTALLDQRNLAGVSSTTTTQEGGLAEALRRVSADPARPIGEAILDQRCVAGIGNLYRCEVLFLRGVSPWTPVRDVDVRALLQLARRLMRANLHHPEQITTGNARRGQHHWVYARAGQACRRCGSRVQRGEQGQATQERVVFWCPRCQPARV